MSEAEKEEGSSVDVDTRQDVHVAVTADDGDHSSAAQIRPLARHTSVDRYRGGDDNVDAVVDRSKIRATDWVGSVGLENENDRATRACGRSSTPC